MKKILLSIFTLLAFLSFGQMAFANQDAGYQIKMGSIADALGPKALGHETDVSVINYTNVDLFVNFGIDSFTVYHQSSGRIVSAQQYSLPIWIYYNGQQIAHYSSVSPFATVSIHYLNGMFLVDVT